MSVCQSVRTSVLAAAVAGLALAGQAQAALTAPVYIDFGPGQQTAQPAYNTIVWNNIGSGLGETVADLADSGGLSTGITVTITDNFQSVNVGGMTATTGDASEFQAAANDSVYTDIGGANNPTGALTLSNLANGSYTFTFYAGRDAGGVRDAIYRVTGANTADSAVLNAASNSANVVTVSNITPNGSGEILIEVLRGPGNDSSWAYLGALKLTEVPEPASLGLLGLGGLLLAAWNERTDK